MLFDIRHNYVVYDDVLAKTLPYYEAYFFGKSEYPTQDGKQSIKKCFMDKKDYDGNRNQGKTAVNRVVDAFLCKDSPK